jgi:hypothetical protein
MCRRLSGSEYGRRRDYRVVAGGAVLILPGPGTVAAA